MNTMQSITVTRQELDQAETRQPNYEDINLITDLGHRYRSAKLPKNIPRGEPTFCYRDSFLPVLRNREKYHYVEGVARFTDGPEVERGWMWHAWISDLRGRFAYDPTWALFRNDKPLPIPFVEYVGMHLPTIETGHFLMASGYDGVIPNRHRVPAKWQQLKQLVEEENRANTKWN